MYGYDDDEEFEPKLYDELTASKKKRKFTKDDAIYGVFNDGYEQDEEEDEYTKMKQTMKHMSTGIKFVSSGVYDPNSAKKLNKDGQIDQDAEAEIEKAKKKQEKKEKKELKKEREKQQKKKQKQQQQSNDIQDVKYTGIGLKMLQKMGYDGKSGLGKDGSGMVEPIKSVARPQGAGLSYVEEHVDDRFNEPISSDSDSGSSSESEDGSGKSKSKGWKKKSNKVKYDFDEHLQQHHHKHKHHHKHHHHHHHKKDGDDKSQQKPVQLIVDMRGPTAMLKSGASEHALTIEDGPLAQLQHNFKLLIRMKELEIQNNDNKLDFEKAKIKSLTNSFEKLKFTLKSDEDQIDKIKEILQLVKESKEKMDQQTLTLKILFKTFTKLYTKYSKEYQKLKLYNLEMELLRPLLIKEIEKWDIDKSPDYLVNEMLKWRTILDPHFSDNEKRNEISQLNQGSDTYFILIRDLFLPHIKSYLRTKWQVKEDPSKAVALVGFWSAALPPIILESILEQSILPRLRSSITQWDPTSDPIPIDSWLHPWIPFLSDQLELLYPQIRQTLMSVLVHWQSGDETALLLLQPWKDIFEGNSMESLLNRAIVPKIHESLKSWALPKVGEPIPSDNPVQYLLEWKQLMPMPMLISILNRSFFPRWITELYNTLISDKKCDDEQLLDWYSDWKDQFESIWEKAENSLKQHFNQVLDMIDRSSQNEPIELPKIQHTEPQTQSKLQPTVNITKNKQTTSTTTKTSRNNDIPIKDLLEELAQNLGHLFIPTSHTDTGQQVYKFGNVPIVLDKGIIMLYEKNHLEPANVDILLEKVKNK